MRKVGVRFAGAVIGTCLLCGLFNPVHAENPTVTSPRHLATVVGPTPIKIDPGVPRDRIERVEVRVNDALLATLTTPPWSAEFDAGDGSHGNRIEVRVFLTDGSTSRIISRTSPLRINQFEDVDLVNLYAMVRGRNGDYVAGLTQDDFRVLENGREQRIQRFSAERKPLRVAIVLDTSKTMEGRKLDKAKRAALEFLDVLSPDDEGMVITFDNSVRVAQDLTRNKLELSAAIGEAESAGGTALYDALYRASRKLEGFEGRRVLVLLSDGRDEAQSGLEPGSLHTLDEALVQALRSEVIIFSIGLGRSLADELDFYRRRTLGSILEQLADKTGGRALISSGVGELQRAFRDVADDLRHQYTLAYTSDDPSGDGGWREIEVLASDKNLNVITRRGYYEQKSERNDAAGDSGRP